MILTEKTPKLDLHGEVTSMVPALVNQFILDNYLLNESVVRIIHGKSTNILTKVVHQVLKTNKKVIEYKLNTWNLGETIVVIQLKK